VTHKNDKKVCTTRMIGKFAQLCKLPYHSCMIPADGFLNKSKHVVMMAS
jgi:hypothetical protein